MVNPVVVAEIDGEHRPVFGAMRVVLRRQPLFIEAQWTRRERAQVTGRKRMGKRIGG